jgi:hypothetical protein
MTRRCAIGHHAYGMRVVAVVEQHLERVLVEHVHAARRLEERRVDMRRLPDRVEPDAERKRQRRGEHRVLHVVQRASSVWRESGASTGRNVAAVVIQRDHLAVDAGLQRTRAAARADVSRTNTCCGFSVT